MDLNDKIVIYQTKDGKTAIDVKLENDTVWLSANQMAALFERDEKTIRKHIKASAARSFVYGRIAFTCVQKQSAENYPI